MVSITEDVVPSQNVWVPAGLVLGGLGAVVGLVLSIWLGVYGIVLAVVLFACGMALAFWWSRQAVDRVLAQLAPVVTDLDALEPHDRARFENLVEGLCLSTGVAEPELVILDDAHPNAITVAGGGVQSVGVTTALLSSLDRIELEGVVAELLVRLRSGDAELATSLASVYTLPARSKLFAPLGRPLARWALGHYLDEFRDVTADQQAVAVTRYPPGLTGAFLQIAEGSGVPASVGRGLDHLWMIPPDRIREVLPIAPLEWRIDVLQEI